MNRFLSAHGWLALFILWTLQGLAAFISLLLLPSDAASRTLLGFSIARLGLVFIAVTFTAISGWLAWREFRTPNQRDITQRPQLWDAVFVACLFLILTSQTTLAILHGLSQEGLVFKYAAYAARLAPLLDLTAISVFELSLWILWLRRFALENARKTLKSAGWAWITLGVAIVIIAATRLGVGPEAIGAWGRPTTPFWEWQIALVWLIGSILILLHLFDKLPRVSHPDLWIALAIWIGVSALWLSQPIRLGWQAGPRAPNFEPYPFSDAMNYGEYAQSLLIGNGLFTNDVPPRVLYIVFLAGLHALAGQDYSHVIALQSLVLALFPVALYLLGREISGRPLGIVLAILAAMRDVMTGLSANYAGNFSYSKFYLSELPTALLLTFFTIFLIRASKRPSWLNINFMLAGGILGLAVLMRTQSAALLPPAFLVAFLGNRKPWREWVKAGIILIVTLALTVAPWFWRNTRVAGGFVLDDPGSQMMWRAMWFNGANEGIIPQLPNETDSQYSKRLTSMAISGFLANPGGNIHAMLDHFVNSEIGNVVLFPVRDGLQSLAEIFIPTRAFWEVIGSNFSNSQLVLIGIYLLIFGLGIGAAWQAKGWIGLMPLTINLAYNFSTALFLSSGMRFLLTADWGFYFYYALGLLTLTRGIFLVLQTTRTRLIRKSAEIEYPSNTIKLTSRKAVVTGCLIFFLLGGSIPLSEHIIPKRYPPVSRAELIRQVATAASISQQEQLQSILQEPGLVVVQGRALYPRYYKADKGEPGTAKMGYEPMPRARLVFFLVGNENITVIFDLAQTPEFFPNASDVIILAPQGTISLSPLAILVKNNGRTEVYFASIK